MKQNKAMVIAQLVMSLVIWEAFALGLRAIIGLIVGASVPYLTIGLIVFGVWVVVIAVAFVLALIAMKDANKKGRRLDDYLDL